MQCCRTFSVNLGTCKHVYRTTDKQHQKEKTRENHSAPGSTCKRDDQKKGEEEVHVHVSLCPLNFPGNIFLSHETYRFHIKVPLPGPKSSHIPYVTLGKGATLWPRQLNELFYSDGKYCTASERVASLKEKTRRKCKLCRLDAATFPFFIS